MPLVANVALLHFLELQAFGAMPLVSNVRSLSFLEQHSSSANVTGCRCRFTGVSLTAGLLCYMPLVLDVGSLQFLERNSSGAIHWLSMSVHCCFLRDRPLVLDHWFLMRFIFVP